MNTCIAIDATEDRLRRFIPRVRTCVRALFREFHLRRVAVDIVIVGNREMEKNVLAYPADRDFPRPDVPKGLRLLGEVYINPYYIEKHGEVLEYMVIHGILHLCGYRHETKRDRMKMERTEQMLMRRLRLSHEITHIVSRARSRVKNS